MGIDYYFEEEPISYDTRFVKSGYALEKLGYLQEDFWRLSFDEAIKLAESGGEPFCNERIDTMLSIISDARMNGADEEDLMDITTYMHTQNSINLTFLNLKGFDTSSLTGLNGNAFCKISRLVHIKALANADIIT